MYLITDCFVEEIGIGMCQLREWLMVPCHADCRAREAAAETQRPVERFKQLGQRPNVGQRQEGLAWRIHRQRLQVQAIPRL